MVLNLIIETFFSIGLFVNAALFVPQAYRLYRLKNAHDLSLLTFGGFNVIQFFMILHAMLHHDVLLLLGSALSFFTCGLVTIQIVIYRVMGR